MNYVFMLTFLPLVVTYMRIIQLGFRFQIFLKMHLSFRMCKKKKKQDKNKITIFIQIIFLFSLETYKFFHLYFLDEK